ncbi:MAG: hypothetical protein OHK006_09900 [Thermodesulfovibrionales bacterium]
MSRVFGVNIGSRSIGLSVSDTRFGFVRHRKSEEAVLPQQGEERAKALAEILRTWKKEYGPCAAVVGLPLRYFTCKVLEMPRLSRGELRGALFFELEKHFPLPVDEYIFDYAVRGQRQASARTLQTVVFAARKDLVENALKPFGDAGISVSGVRCSAITALAAVLEAAREPRFSGQLLYGGDDGYELLLVEQGLPVSARRLGRDAEIVHVVEQAREDHPGKVYAVGAVDAVIAERIGGIQSFVNVASRLSASARRRSPLDLNFLPIEMAGPVRDYYPIVIGGLAAASVLLFLAAGVSTYALGVRRLNQLQMQVQSAKQEAEGLIEAKKKADRLSADEAALQEFALSSNMPVRLLADLSLAMPANSWIVNFSMDEKGKIEIEGISKKTSEVIVALEKSSKVKNVTFITPITYKDGEERFSIRMEPAE